MNHNNTKFEQSDVRPSALTDSVGCATGFDHQENMGDSTPIDALLD